MSNPVKNLSVLTVLKGRLALPFEGYPNNYGIETNVKTVSF
jgi:hypothetical protein